MTSSQQSQDTSTRSKSASRSLLKHGLASIRVKTILAIVSVLLVLLALSAYFLQTVVLRGFLGLEQQAMQTNVTRVTRAIEIAADQVDSATRAWSAWDDTYAFAATPNQAYLDANTSDNWFTQYDINVMIFVDASGRVLFSKTYDFTSHTAGSTSPVLLDSLAPSTVLLTFNQSNNHHVGLVALPEGPMLLASRPILTSAETGPSRGTVVLGRYLDAAKIAELNTITQTPFSISDVRAGGGTPEIQAARSQLQTSGEPVIHPLSDTILVGYGLLKDITDQPALVVRLEQPRAIYLQGQRQSQYLLVALVIGGLVLGGLLLLLVEQLVLRRLITLDRWVAHMGISGDHAARLAFNGNDELARLNSSINTMLDTQTRIQAERQQLEQERITDLERTTTEQRALVAELEASLAARAALSQVVQDLSVPTIPVLPKTIVIPLVGSFEGTRADHLLNIVLNAVQRQSSSTVIIDLTGVTLVDTAIARALIDLVTALRLLGAETILVGMRPEVAQTLVQLGITLADCKVAANLQTVVVAIAARIDS